MNTPLFTWYFIIGIVILVLAADAVCAYRRNHKAGLGKHRLIDVWSEREVFFVPGDPAPRNSDNYDYEDFEDL
ncbi:MAG: hypothetical protein NC411_06715 [Bacteroides sp.]|nr:hypothetical protein [Bacteroides sp.]